MNYKINESDIRGCSREGCNYFGVLSNKKCSNPLICELCGKLY